MAENKNSEEEIVHEDWTFKKSKHTRTSRKRWTVLSIKSDGKVKIETFKDKARSEGPTESFEITRKSCVVLKPDPTKFRIFLDGVNEGYRSFTTANSGLASIWCAAIGKSINDMATQAEKGAAPSEPK